MQYATPNPDEIVCHCLRVTLAEMQSAIVASDAPTVKSLIGCTGAGGGCTACHPAIRKLIADQCPFAASSPTCVMR